MIFRKHKTQEQRVWELLKKRGSDGAYNYELNRIAFRYGALIHIWRKDGHKIVTDQVKRGVFKYTLVDESV